MKGIAAATMMVALLTGCTSQNVHEYGQIDSSARTVTVPAGSGGLVGMIKAELHDAGWKMNVYRGPTVSQGTAGKETNIQQFDTFNTRYSLSVKYNQVDTCIKDFKGYSSFDISMVDNQTGTEVFTLDGAGCDVDTAKKFRSML
jgi:hypothetical protein